MPNANQSSVKSSQGYKADDRNQNILVYVNGEFSSRDSACVSIFDSGFVCGDGVWEGLRLVNGRLIELDEHLGRLYSGAKFITLDMDNGPELIATTNSGPTKPSTTSHPGNT